MAHDTFTLGGPSDVVLGGGLHNRLREMPARARPDGELRSSGSTVDERQVAFDETL